jgi:muramidase (phage lysozyme)
MIKTSYPQLLNFNQVGNTSASNITNAIKAVESGGNYNAKGASGEFGAYQFMPNTWKQWAGEFLGDPNAKPTPQNQDYVANAKVNSLIQQGYTPEQIALIWNGGTPVRKSGVNKFGVKYDSGAYADKVLATLRA